MEVISLRHSHRGEGEASVPSQDLLNDRLLSLDRRLQNRM